MAAEINEGANGFHLFTVVTDGYGGLISEDSRGHAIARVESGPEEAEDPAPFLELMRLTFAVLNGDAEPINPNAVDHS